MKLLVVLQNAYSNKPFPSTRVQRRWVEGIWKPGGTGWKSHTGKRLMEMLPDDAQVFVTNACTEVGFQASSLFRPDLSHIRQAIYMHEPDKILACGKVAQKALEQLDYDFVAAPHPAYRLLSKKMTAEIKAELSRG